MIPGSQRNCKPRALGHLGASQLQKPQRASMAQAPGRILLIQPLGTCLHQPPLMALGGSGGLWLPKSFHKPWFLAGSSTRPTTKDQAFDPTQHQDSSHNPRIPCHLMPQWPLWVQSPGRLLQAPSLLHH